MDHAIKGGKLISFQLICQYFQIRKAFLNTPFVTKKFLLHFYRLFWNLLVLDTAKSYSFVCFFYFFNGICNHDLVHHAFWYLNICTLMARIFSIFHMHLFKSKTSSDEQSIFHMHLLKKKKKPKKHSCI